MTLDIFKSTIILKIGQFTQYFNLNKSKILSTIKYKLLNFFLFMTTNTLDQIKQAEEEAKKIIEQAKVHVENLISQANQNNENSLASVQNRVSTQIGEIIENAKKEIQSLKTKQERDLERQLQELNNIDNKIIDQAARIVVKKIL